MKVSSSFDIETFTCAKLDSHIFQLAVLLYPPELVNEKFLISVRDCMVKLSNNHPVKKWLKMQSQSAKPDVTEQAKIDFLSEMLNTQFNLLTDQKIKTKVIGLIADIPENSNIEKLLKSYLYLMIGNITRSDNILKSIIAETPRTFYQGHTANPSMYQRMTLIHLEKVLRKFARHPADRLTFYLFTVYIKKYLNQTELVDLVEDLGLEDLQDKIRLNYTERIAFELTGFARLSRMSEKRRFKILRTDKYSAEMQSYWVWPYLDMSPLISDLMATQVQKLDSTDPLWAVYVLDNEKLSDLYFKKGGTPVSRKRAFLRNHLTVPSDYMLTLYKLIEIGDIDNDLVMSVSRFIHHE